MSGTGDSTQISESNKNATDISNYNVNDLTAFQIKNYEMTNAISCHSLINYQLYQSTVEQSTINRTPGMSYNVSYINNDPALPKELTSQFQPLYCKLCSVQLTSSIMAKLHYDSKNHHKKVRRYLFDYSERTGEPLHKQARIENNSKKEIDSDPRNFYCETCDLVLTGKLHADSHYMGRNHQKVVSGKKLPAGQGFYDPQGKWIRVTPSKADASLRGDNFGQDFLRCGPNVETDALVKAPSSNLRCEICNVNATSLVQMEMHYNGQKHKKKLKQLGVVVAQDGAVEGSTAEGIPKDNILTSVINDDRGTKDMSVFRTPTGYFYCKTCNITLNSEVQFKQHLSSKNHFKKNSAIPLTTVK